tara:strand:+ start:1156 stop:1719 length:564 start_codon:yes stop_codon:yes gene_type:complete
MIIKPAFITPVFEFNIYDKELNNLLREDAYYQKEINNGRQVSNEGGFQSNHIYDSKAVSTFFQKIEPCVLQVKQTINYDRDLTLEGLWYNINKKGDKNKLHCHGRSILGATYYIDTPSNCGAISFENLDKHIIMNSEVEKYDTPYFNGFFNVEPKQGTLLIFYAWLNHLVEDNKSDEDRVSLGFNIQ